MEWKGIHVSTHHDVYLPSDDSHLLADAAAAAVKARIERHGGCRFLEVGCGTGLVALTAARAGARAVAADVNPRAVELARHNAKENRLELEAVEADLLDGLQGPFDVVAFNPPYLPTAEDEHVDGLLDIAFDGGPDGNRVVMRFAQQLAAWPPGERPAEVLVVHSSLSDPGPLIEAMHALGYEDDVALHERFFYEELTVRRFQR